MIAKEQAMHNKDTMRMSLKVPCSTSNLGPGFDCLGCALSLYNEFDIEFLENESASNTLQFSGPESGKLRATPNNLFFSSVARFFRRIGQPSVPISVKARVNVPNARGLGSSATAIVAAIMAANRFAGDPFSRNDLVRIATEIEGHPDNVSPAILGGLTASLKGDDGHVVVSRFQPHGNVSFVFLSPEYEVSTKAARSALPANVAHHDAVANVCRVPLLIDALVKGNFGELPLLMQDRLHEPYREKLYPNFTELKQAAIKAGAAGVCLSGAGPTMLAVVEKMKADEVAEKWQQALLEFKMNGKVRVLGVDPEGAVIQ